MPAALPPPMQPSDWDDLRHGATLFNAGRFWHAHEAWEAVWRRHQSSPAQTFFKGLIQLAAAHHQREAGRRRGMLEHFARARAKLAPFAPRFLGVEVAPLLEALDLGAAEARRLDDGGLEKFDRALIPLIQIVEPAG